MDIVYIRELEIETIIGIYDWEREQKQVVSLDLEMGTDISLAASSEDIANTLDYKAVAEEFSVPWLKLRLGKPGAVTGSKDVGVIIERGSR